MNIITIHSQKGGSGKTTLAAHLAVQAVRAGRKPLIADLDPQQSLQKWWQRRQADDLLLVSNPPLDGLAAAAADAGADLIIIDTPPRSAASTLAAMELADLTLIPCRPSVLDVDALDNVAALVARAKVGRRHAVVINHAPAPRGVLSAEAGVVTETREAIASLGLIVAGPAIADRAAFRHALNDGRAVAEFEPAGKAAAEVAALWNFAAEYLS